MGMRCTGTTPVLISSGAGADDWGAVDLGCFPPFFSTTMPVPWAAWVIGFSFLSFLAAACFTFFVAPTENTGSNPGCCSAASATWLIIVLLSTCPFFAFLGLACTTPSTPDLAFVFFPPFGFPALTLSAVVFNGLGGLSVRFFGLATGIMTTTSSWTNSSSGSCVNPYWASKQFGEWSEMLFRPETPSFIDAGLSKLPFTASLRINSGITFTSWSPSS
mmetsp:Transcript_1558/g.1913  ORF Transcript_1558/g.1913 Transcript_1558/m.1913 type:complete len:218 (+) Transcript_1558:1156-1809(+)